MGGGKKRAQKSFVHQKSKKADFNSSRNAVDEEDTISVESESMIPLEPKAGAQKAGKRGRNAAPQEEEEEEIFRLGDGADDEDSDEDEDGDEDADSDEEGESEDEEEEEEEDVDDDLHKLVANLNPSLRQKVMLKKHRSTDSDDDDEDDEDDEDEGKEESWGKKKGVYWTGDTADLEIGQEMEDAEEEEAAAEDLYREKAARLQDADFFEDFDSGGDDEDDEDGGEREGGSSNGKGLEKRLSDVVADKNKKDKKSDKSKKSSLIGSAAAAGGRAGAGAGADDFLEAGDLSAYGSSLNRGTEENGEGVQVEQLHRDLSAVSKNERLQLLATQAPELVAIADELKERVAELKQRITPVRDLVLRLSKLGRADDDIVDYLEMKQQLLLSYCINVTFYLYMKALGKSVRSHPVMKQLLKLRYIMERMRPLDGKLQSQIDRLLKAATLLDSATSTNSSSNNGLGATGGGGVLDGGSIPDGLEAVGWLRPRPSDFMLDEDEEDDDEEEDEGSGDDGGSDSDSDSDDKRGKKRAKRRGKGRVDSDDDGEDAGGKNVGLYRAPRIAAMPYKEQETAASKREKQLEKQRQKLKNSELLEALREEFDVVPQRQSSTGHELLTADEKQLDQEAEERKDFEEDQFVRLTMTRKEKKSIKRRELAATRLDNFDDIGDMGNLSDLARDLSSSSAAARGGGGGSGVDYSEDADALTAASLFGGVSGVGAGLTGKSAKALQRAVNALSQPSNKYNNRSNSVSKGMDKKATAMQQDDLLEEERRGATISQEAGGGKKNKKSKKSKDTEMDMEIDDVGDNPFSALLNEGGGSHGVGEGTGAKKRRRAPEMGMDNNPAGGDGDDDGGVDLLADFAQKKKEFLAKKKEHYSATPRFGGYEDNLQGGDGKEEEARRAATYEIVENKGLRPHRKKENRNARVKKRNQYAKALVRRKGQVREVISGAAGAYGGEMTGIKTGISRSRRLGGDA